MSTSPEHSACFLIWKVTHTLQGIGQPSEGISKAGPNFK